MEHICKQVGVYMLFAGKLFSPAGLIYEIPPQPQQID